MESNFFSEFKNKKIQIFFNNFNPQWSIATILEECQTFLKLEVEINNESKVLYVNKNSIQMIELIN